MSQNDTTLPSPTQKKITTYDVVGIGFMAALVFVSSMISIPLPGETRIHLGNAFCVLSGLLLGGTRGGLAAGFGSALFDVFNPLYIRSAPFTFLFKFMIAFLSGKIAYGKGRDGKQFRYNLIGAISGTFCYVALYLSKSFLSDVWFARTEIETALVTTSIKAGASCFNAVTAILIAIPLALALRPALERFGLYKKIRV